jgi:Fe-Mn family superoxide dismutase
MEHKLPDLPFEKKALEPHISAETLEFHHDKHHQAYVNKLNELIKGSKFESAALEDIIRKADGGIFNNGAQVFNHTFFWNCLTPSGGGRPGGALAQAIEKKWGSFDAFRKAFSETAAGLFGSGWTWLVKGDDGSLEIVPMSNAGNPLREGKTPLLTLDVWEHAYYIDYRNARPKFVEAFWNLVNWDFVERNFA